MADEARKPAGRSLTWLWMILALVVVGGFLTWLGTTSEPTSVPVVEADTAAAGGGEGGLAFTAVPKDSLKTNKGRYAGQVIRVAGVQITGSLGPRIFWGELGNQSSQVPILVRVDSAAAAGTKVQPGASYTLTGTMQAMSDSVSGAWADQGEFTGDGERMQADFADYYLQVSNIQASRTSPGSAGGAAPGSQGER